MFQTREDDKTHKQQHQEFDKSKIAANTNSTDQHRHGQPSEKALSLLSVGGRMLLPL